MKIRYAATEEDEETKCPDCKGHGCDLYDPDEAPCITCGGEGWI